MGVSVKKPVLVLALLILAGCATKPYVPGAEAPGMVISISSDFPYSRSSTVYKPNGWVYFNHLTHRKQERSYDQAIWRKVDAIFDGTAAGPMVELDGYGEDCASDAFSTTVMVYKSGNLVFEYISDECGARSTGSAEQMGKLFEILDW